MNLELCPPPPLSIIFFPITRQANLNNINLLIYLKNLSILIFFLLQHLFFLKEKRSSLFSIFVLLLHNEHSHHQREEKQKQLFLSLLYFSTAATRRHQPPCDLRFSFTSFLYQHPLLLSLHHKSYRSVIDPIYSIISHLFLVFLFSIECGFILLYNRRTFLGCFWVDT